VSRNLTLAIDDGLLRAARKVAIERDTTVNHLVRGFLEELVAESGEQRKALKNIEQLFEERPFVIGKKNWTRADLHER
jgi:hypothetical protein